MHGRAAPKPSVPRAALFSPYQSPREVPMPASAFAPAGASNELMLPVAEYWLKARIDAPLAGVERLDQNAKQMIALAGGLQVVLTAIIKLAPDVQPAMLRIAMVSFSFLFLSVVCSAIVLFRQQRVLATRFILPVLSKTSTPDIMDALTDQVTKICEDVDGVVKWKKSFLIAALASFAVSMLGSIGCLYVMLP
jgi:hypothetical protein